MSPSRTAHDITALLQRHYQPDNRAPAGVFAPEIESPCATRRADLIWMPTTVTGGKGNLHGHEIKVTRSDVLAELADPTKADPWAKYCHRWWLVVAHPRLVEGLDIPGTWGVMAPPSGRRRRSMTIIRQAPALSPQEPGKGIARLAAWLLYRHYTETRKLTTTLQARERDLARLQQRVAELEATRLDPNSSRHSEKVARIIHTAARQLDAAGVLVWEIEEEHVVAALVDHLATATAAETLRQDLERLAKRVDDVLDPFRYVRGDLDKARKLAADLARSRP